MLETTQLFKANLKHAIFDRETVTIGGGEFSPGELKDVLRALDEHEQLHDAAALLNRIENIESSQATITTILVRMETRLCKIAEHIGAAHLINSRNP